MIILFIYFIFSFTLLDIIKYFGHTKNISVCSYCYVSFDYKYSIYKALRVANEIRIPINCTPRRRLWDIGCS